MKSIYIKLLLFFVLALGLAKTLYAQNTTPLKSSVINVVNVTQMAKAYFTQDISLGNYTGVDFTDVGLMELLTEAQSFTEELGYEVFAVEFPHISTNANEGLEGNYQLALDQIQSDKFILFCYVLTTGASENLGDFYTAIINTEDALSEEEIEYFENYTNDKVQADFDTEGIISGAYASEAEGLRRLKSSMFSEEYIDVPMDEIQDFIQDEMFMFLTPAGKIISLPDSISGITFFSGDEAGSTYFEGSNCSGNYIITPFGTLRSFFKGETFYLAQFSCSNSGNFNGYLQVLPNNSQQGIWGEKYEDFYTKEYFNNINHVILGYPCYEESQIKFKLGKIAKEDAFNPSAVPPPAPLSLSYGNGPLASYNQFISRSSSLQDSKNINANITPSLSTPAISFLETFEEDCSCTSPTASYVFAHANQVSLHPALFEICGDNILLGGQSERDLIISRAVLAYKKNEVSNWHAYATAQEYTARLEALNNVPSDIFSDAEMEFWIGQDASIYRQYEEVIPDYLSDAYWENLDVDNTAEVANCFQRLLTVQGDECVFLNFSAEARLKALKVLLQSELNDHLWIFNEGVEEPAFIYLLNTAPASEYRGILDWIRGEDNSFETYFSIVAKLEDSYIYSNDGWGFEPFVIRYTQMVQQSTFLEYYSPVIGVADCSGYAFNINNDVYCPHLFRQYLFAQQNATNYVEYTENKIKIRTEYSTYLAVTPLPLVKEYRPDEFIVFELSENLTLRFSDGEIKSLAAGFHVLPAAFVDLLIRRWSDASFNFKFKVVTDIIGVASALVSSSPFIITGGIVGAIDALLFASDFYNYEIGAELQFWDEGQLAAWNQVQTIVAIPDMYVSIGGLVRGINLGSVGTKLRTLRAENPFLYRQLADKVSGACNSTYQRLLSLSLQGTLTSDLILLKEKLETLILSLHLKSNSQLLQELKVAVNNELKALILYGTIEWEIATGVFHQNVLKYNLNNIIGDFSNSGLPQGSIQFKGIVRSMELEGFNTNQTVFLYLNQTNNSIHSLLSSTQVYEGELSYIFRIVESIDNPLQNHPDDIISAFRQLSNSGIGNFGYTAANAESIIKTLTAGSKFSRWNSNFSQKVAGFLKLADDNGSLPSIINTVDNFDEPKFLQFLDDINSQTDEYFGFLAEGGMNVDGWDGMFNAPYSVRRNLSVLARAEDLLSIGFIKSDLNYASTIIGKFESNISGITNVNLEKIGEFMLEARYHSANFDEYGIITDVFGQLDIAISSNRFKFPDLIIQNELSQYIKEMAIKMRPTNSPPNPGFLEQLNEAILVLNNGGEIVFEKGFINGSLFSLDIIDEAGEVAIHFKAPVGSTSATLTSNVRGAVKQFRNSLEPAPQGFNRIAKVKILNTSQPDFSKSTLELKVVLQNYISSNGNITDLIDDFHRVHEVQIVNNLGLHKFRVQNTVVSIIQ